MDHRDDSKTVPKNPLQMVQEYSTGSASADRIYASWEADTAAFIEIIESAGATWCVIGGSKVVQPYMVFEMPRDVHDSLLLDAVRAMRAFDKLFRSSAEARSVTIEHAMSIGSYFVELGNAAPVVSLGTTNQ